MANDLDRRRNVLARMSEPRVVALTAMSVVGVVAYLAKPITIEVGDVDFSPMFVAGPVIYQISNASEPPAIEATYYLSPSGLDSNDGSEGSPWKTFSKAFTTMGAGDTLGLLNGTYSVAAGTGVIHYLGTNSAQVPSGNSTSDMTTVIGLNGAGNVTIEGALFVGRSFRKDSYVEISGIKFEGGGALYNTSNVYVHDSGFYDDTNGSGTVFGIGTNDHANGNTDNLIEDVWIWGRNRIIATNYRAERNVWRRVVVRGDGCDAAACAGSGNPNVGFTVYESDSVSVQNMIHVDRILDGGEPYADYATAEHTAGGINMGHNEWLGSMSINSEENCHNFEADAADLNPVSTVHHFVCWDPGGGGLNFGDDGYHDIQHFTVYRTGGSTSDGVRVAPDVDAGSTLKNGISFSGGRYGINSVKQPSYTNVYNAAWTSSYNQTSCATGCVTTDPTADGTPASLKYPLRIEVGSALDGAGDGGADIGATIVKRYGSDGLFRRDSGSNTLGSTDLWPWDNEALIKTQMCADRTSTWCGTSDTLTEYIWEQLGNGSPY